MADRGHHFALPFRSSESTSYANSGRRAMDAATFLKGKATLAEGAATANPDVAVASALTEASTPSASGASEPVSEQSPPLIFKDTTPSGIVVEYEAKPKRLYRVNGVEAVSVTTALKVLHKELSWWGQGIGVAGVLELFSREKLATVIDWASNGQKPVIVDGLAHSDATAEAVVALLTAEHLTVNQTKDKAADRGTSVHKALQDWADSRGEFYPSPQNFPETEQPFVSGVLDWINAMDGAGKPVLSEVMVGSSVYGFAGRCDLVLELSETRTFVTRALKTPKTITVSPGRYMVDMKTKNKRPRDPYTTDMKQLAGYEIASVEGGYPPTDGQFVLYVMANGTYEFAPSHAVAKDFLDALTVWKSDEAMAKRKKAAQLAAKASA